MILKLLLLPAAPLVALLIAATSLAQTPSPTPVPFECGGIKGSGANTISYQAVLITPPVGHVYSWVAQSGEQYGNWVQVCVVDLGSSIVLDAQTGAEIIRHVNDPAAGPILDQIAASVRINPIPTPIAPGRSAEQPPRPTPGPSLRCSGITAPGGRPIAYDGIIVTMPTGYVYNWTANRDAFGDYMSICVVELASTIVLDSITGQELLRDVKDPRADAVLDAIVASARINPMPTPRPPAQPEPGKTFVPPNTGDAGILPEAN